MRTTAKQSSWGPAVGEEFNFLFFDTTTNDPIYIESIGISYPNSNYYIHRETSDFFIFEYVISGKGYIETAGKKYEVKAGDVYCLEPGKGHTYYSDKKDPYQKIWINMYSNFLGSIFSRFKISGKIVFPNSNCRKYFDEILALRSISGNSSVICYRVLAILLNIMCSLADLTQQQRQQIHIPKTALSIKNLLDQNIYSTVTIQQIADSFSYDKAHIIREFEKHYHQTPYQYLLSQKILIAKKLLLGTNVSITNISEQLGFKSVFYFSRLFKKKVGLSPREYRIQSIES